MKNRPVRSDASDDFYFSICSGTHQYSGYASHIFHMSCCLAWLSCFTKTKKYLIYLFYFVTASAFLIKGVIGVVFPFGILIIWLIWAGRWRQTWKLFSPVGILIFMAAVCPWLILAQKENPDFLWFFFVREHFLRFTTKMHGKTEPFYFYLPIIAGGVLPWIFYIIKAWKINTSRNLCSTRMKINCSLSGFY